MNNSKITMKNILIIGGGEIGKAVHFILSQKAGVSPLIYDSNPIKATTSLSLEELTKSSDVIFLCIPSSAVQEIVSQISNGEHHCIIVSLIKGIEPSTQKWIDEFLELFFPNNVALLSGPMLAEEIMAGFSTKAMCACTNDTFKIIKSLFENTTLFLEHNEDVRGVAVQGVLKNVYAIGLGVIDALKLGANYKSVFVVKALQEISLLTKHFGGQSDTAYSLSGLGDLIATGYSNYSKNHLVGEELVVNGTCSIKSEGCLSLPFVIKLIGQDLSHFPLLSMIHRIMHQGAKPIEECEVLLRSE